MSSRNPSLLAPFPVALDSPEFREICLWPFTDAYVGRLLQGDIRQRMQFRDCELWVYSDPAPAIVGFGTIQISDNAASSRKDGVTHTFHCWQSTQQSSGLGHGTVIVRHLISEAAKLVVGRRCHDVLFLDVYADNDAAIKLYKKCGFEQLPIPSIPDDRENGRLYIYMSKRVSFSSA